jgi:hypothetical protein
MRYLRSAAGLLAIALCGCSDEAAEDEPVGELVGKCVFPDGVTEEIDPGEVFLYAFHDVAGASFSVVTGVATTLDSVLDRVVVERADRAEPARKVGEYRLEWGNLDAAAEGDADYFVGINFPPGEVVSSSGSAPGTDSVYPSCVFRDL